MIKFSERVSRITSQSTVNACYLVTMGNMRFTNHPSDVVLPTGEVFSSNDRLVSVDMPTQSTSVDSQPYKVTFADPDYYFGSMAETGLVGTYVILQIVFEDQETNELALGSDDILDIYRGEVSSAVYDITTDAIGEVLFQVTCASPMANLDQTRTFEGNKKFMRENINAEDSTFDLVYDSSVRLRTKWGKK